MKHITSIIFAGIIAFTTNPVIARDQIRIVGSSTVYPFATVVAERFGKKSKFKTPVVESTGSGGGLKLFCGGIGSNTPDITNSSRRIKKSEFDKCSGNGVQISEFKFGYDGIVFANSTKSKLIDLSRRDIFMALAKLILVNGKLIDNPNKTWKDVNPSLPDIKIKVYGPPPTSGTRDAFNELAMEGGCNAIENLKNMFPDKKKYKAICHGIREDNVWIESGENDNLIVQKLNADPNTFGVFGFSFLNQNKNKVQGSIINGVKPTFENILSRKYPIGRSLFFYVKRNHVNQIPGMNKYIRTFMHRRAIGKRGYLVSKGLIPLSKSELRTAIKAGIKLPQLKM